MLFLFSVFLKEHCMAAAAFLPSHRTPQQSTEQQLTDTIVHAVVSGLHFEMLYFGNFYWDCQWIPGNSLKNNRVPDVGRNHRIMIPSTLKLSWWEEARSLHSIRERVAGFLLRPIVSWASIPAAMREGPAASLLSELGNGHFHNGSWLVGTSFGQTEAKWLERRFAE